MNSIDQRFLSPPGSHHYLVKNEARNLKIKKKVKKRERKPETKQEMDQ